MDYHLVHLINNAVAPRRQQHPRGLHDFRIICVRRHQRQRQTRADRLVPLQVCHLLGLDGRLSRQPSTLRLTRRAQAKEGSKKEPPYKSDGFIVRHELVIVIVNGLEVGEVDLVPKQAADATEALDELRTLLRAVGHELQVGTELLVLVCEPFEERLRLGGLLHLEPGRLVSELLAVLLLLLVDVDDDFLYIATLSK